MSRHSRCGCKTRSNGSVDYCSTHRLTKDIDSLTTTYIALSGLAGGKKVSGSGAREGDAVPVNLTLLGWCSGWYEEREVDDSGTVTGAINVPGVTPTVLLPTGIIAAARRTLKEVPPQRQAPEVGHAPVFCSLTDKRVVCSCGWSSDHHTGALGTFAIDEHLRESQEFAANPRVVEDLGWLKRQSERLVAQSEATAGWVQGHVQRLARRGEQLLHGSTFTPGWGLCPECHVTSRWWPSGTLLSAPARTEAVTRSGVTTIERVPAMATCLNDECSARDKDSTDPPCWRQDESGEWKRIEAPKEDWLGRKIVRPSVARLAWDAVLAQHAGDADLAAISV